MLPIHPLRAKFHLSFSFFLLSPFIRLQFEGERERESREVRTVARFPVDVTVAFEGYQVFYTNLFR